MFATPREDVHAEGLAVAGHDRADLAVAVDPERLAAQADPDRISLPLAGPERVHLLRDATERRDDQAPRELGGRVRRPARAGVGAHEDATSRARFDVDMRKHAGLADQLELGKGLEQRREARGTVAG